MKIMKSMGVNAFRTSHNPPSPEMVEVCQELGIVMMVEAFDTWRTPKRQYDYGRFFDANSDSDIAEMVNAAKNSPAVVLSSIGNEIPDSTSATVGLPIAKRLVADIEAIDTTRPIVIGSDKYRSVPATGSGQGRDGAAALVQPRSRQGVGVRRVAGCAVRGDRARVLHHRRHARAPSRHRREVLGRGPVGGREQPARHACDRVRRADRDHVRPGLDDEAAPRHDERAPEGRRRLHRDQHPGGSRRRG
jgi:Glycosyl hydrolases family 2, TIM barrel domain